MRLPKLRPDDLGFSSRDYFEGLDTTTGDHGKQSLS